MAMSYDNLFNVLQELISIYGIEKVKEELEQIERESDTEEREIAP